MKPQAKISIGLLILILASLACNLPSGGNSTPQAAATLDQLYTAAAETEQAVTSAREYDTAGHRNQPVSNTFIAHSDPHSGAGDRV